MENWRDLVIEAAGRKASDVFWKPGNSPHVRVKGEVEKCADRPVVTPEDTEQMAEELMDEHQWELFQDFPERDIGLTVGDICRLRINIYRERGNIGLVMRIIALDVMTLDELEMPSILKDVAMNPQGLVLVTGPTGCGKSTTLAAMMNHINMERSCNIITIEDPIEYVHRDKNSIVSQREVGVDTMSFTDALKYVVRQNPDVILIGEMRDVETMQVAMQAAETGHLVFSTVHTTSAAETLERIINMFPPHEKAQICLRMAKTLKSIVSQALVPRVDTPDRTAAMEIMVVTPTVGKMIEDGKPGDTYAAIQEGGYWGMQTVNQALLQLFQEEKISAGSCLFYAGNYTEMRQMLRRVSPEAADQADEEMPGLGAVRGDVPDAVKQAAAASGRAGQVIEKHEAPKKASKDSDKRRPARRAARPARRSPEK